MLRIRQPVTEGEMRSHLRLVHGLYVYDEKTVEGLERCHIESHEDPGWGRVFKHEHFAVVESDELEEWVW
jgi:hypothetical protein